MSSPRHPNARRWAVLSPIWLVYAAYALRFWHTGDDAYITFRYSRNLASGLGLRYNPGEAVPVEGYSNFLWMILAVPFEILGVDVPTAMNLLSFAIGSVLLVGMYRALTVHLELRPAIAAASTALVVLSPVYTMWATSGLETMAFAALLFATFERLALARDRHAGLLGGLAAIGLALVRTEGIGWVAVILALAAVGRLVDARRTDRPLPKTLHRGPREVLAPLVAAVGVSFPVWLAYFVGRAWWFGSWSSNTFKAKVHLDVASLEQGVFYVLASSLATMIPPLLLLGGIAGLRRQPAYAAPATLLFGGFGVYAVLVGGDYMPFARLLMPALPIGALLGGWLLATISERQGRGSALALAAVAVIVGLLPAHDLDPVPRSMRAALHFRTNTTRVRTEYQQWEFIARTAETWRELGEAMAAHAPADATWATGAIGAKGYYSRLHIHDVGGLVDREVAERDGRNARRSPGHEKTVPVTYFLDREPTFLQAKVVPAAEAEREIGSWRFGRDVRARYAPETIDLGDGRALVWLRRADTSERVAAAPTSAEPGEAYRRHLHRLESFADPDGSRPAPEGGGVTVAEVDAGLQLYVSGHAPEAHVLAGDGEIVHTWRLPFAEAFPGRAIDGKGSRYWRHATVLPDGSLVALFDGQGLVKLDRNSGLVWAWTGRAHHAVDIDEAGNLWTLTRGSGIVPELDPVVPVVSDHVTVLSPDGVELRSFSVVDALLASPFRELLGGKPRGDLLQLTSLALLDGSVGPEAFAPGHLLIASRGLDAVLVVDPERERVVWALADRADPTDADLLPDGGLLVSENPSRSRVVELDPSTGEVRWSFDGPPAGTVGGLAERLADGRTLIVDVAGGRAAQVTRDGDIVWAYGSPHRAEDGRLVAHLFGVWPLPSDLPTDWLD